MQAPAGGVGGPIGNGTSTQSQTVSPEAQLAAITNLNATASAPAPITNNLGNAQQLVTQTCSGAPNGTSTQITGNVKAAAIQK